MEKINQGTRRMWIKVIKTQILWNHVMEQMMNRKLSIERRKKLRKKGNNLLYKENMEQRNHEIPCG